jgi:signal transduction histidine kinase
MAISPALLANPDLLELAVQQLPVGVFILGADGRQLLANPKAEALLRADPQTRALPELRAFLPDGQPCPQAELPHARALVRGERVVKTALDVCIEDGARVAVLASAAPVRGVGGDIDAAVGVFEDLAASGDRERERDARAERQLQLERRMIGIVSHDLRDLLQSLSLSTATLLRVAPSEPRTRRSLTRMRVSIERAARMIGDLLDFSQMREAGTIAIRVAPVSLQTVVCEALDELLPAFPNRRIQQTCDGDAYGLWDPDRLAQIAANLLSNALKYGAEGSPVVIRMGGDAHWAYLEVTNFGEPIAADQIGRLFMPFERAGKLAGRCHGGLGLGLFIVDQLVRSHQGRVEVSSTREEGTTFRIRLPREPSAAAMPDPAAA